MSGAQARKKDRWADTYVRLLSHRGRTLPQKRADAPSPAAAAAAAAQIPAEETIRNDYSGHYVQTGQRPQNHLRNTAVETRFSECARSFPPSSAPARPPRD